MVNLVCAEYYKMWRNRSIFSILALAAIPFVFALVVALDLKTMTMSEGAFNLISFPTSMWQFVLGTTLSIIVLSYLSASMGRELKNGSLIYQVTRVANRKKLIASKVWTILSFNLLYFVLFYSTAMLSYVLIVSRTRFSGEFVMDLESRQQLLLTAFTVLFQFLFCILSFLLSFKLSTIGLVIFSFVSTTLLSLLSSVQGISMFVPGSVFYAPQLFADGQFETVLLFQSLLFILVSLVTIGIAHRLFSRVSV